MLNNYFCFLEKMLGAFNFGVPLLMDLSIPCSDWNYGLPSINCHYYAKLKGEVIYSSICLLRLSQYNYSNSGVGSLDLVFFSNFVDRSVNHD
jgi:hypothetical protein